jgi:hypothetical protein
MKLKLGKIYVDGLGVRVKIVNYHDSPTDKYPFKGSNGQLYTDCGEYYYGKYDARNLNELTTRQLTLSVGKSYKNRLGEIVKITKYDVDLVTYPFLGNDDILYTKDGRYSLNLNYSDKDLIAEVPTVEEDSMKLEVGKIYEDDLGNIVKIVKQDLQTNAYYIFIGDNGECYTQAGRYNHFDENDERNLHNYPTKNTPLVLKIGSSYKNGRGEIVTIVANNEPSDVYPFRGDNNEIYTINGRWSLSYTSNYDLVAEVTYP